MADGPIVPIVPNVPRVPPAFLEDDIGVDPDWDAVEDWRPIELTNTIEAWD